MSDDYCLDLARRFDRDRYLCALFLPEAARRHALALIAFNVELARVRETVREAALGRIRLQWWREMVEAARAGHAREQPVARAIASLLAEHDAADQLMTMIEARERDLDDAPFADLAELERYAEASAAPLLRLGLRLVGAREAAGESAARRVAIGWALIGLLRAVPFHARQRRVLLPADALARHGVDLSGYLEGRGAPAALADVAREIAAAASAHLDAARATRRELGRPALRALLLAALARRHLRRIERAGFDPTRPELARADGLDALALAWSAWRGAI